MNNSNGYFFPELVYNASDIDLVLQSIILVAARVQAFFYLAPFIGSRSMPRLVRTGLVMSLALIAMPSTVETLDNTNPRSFDFMGLLARNVMLGAFLGILVWLPVRGLEFVGVFLDTQRGATTAEDFDIIFNAQTTPTAILLSQIFSGYFFASGGFLIVTWLLTDSIILWPPANTFPMLNTAQTLLFIRIAGTIFFSALLIALPIAGFLFLGDIAVTLIARVAPTLNALAFAMPIKSAILLVMIIFYIELAFPVIFEKFSDSLNTMKLVLEHER